MDTKYVLLVGAPHARAITDLQDRLEEAADPAVKEWFERYLKYAVQYRGVKTPQVSRIVANWRSAHRLAELPVDRQLALAGSLITETHAEDKFAGIIYIQKFLLRSVSAGDILNTAEELFRAEAFGDWSTTDWFCVRVLGPTLVRHGIDTGRRIAGWHQASGLWHRRASIVPFRSVVCEDEFHPLIQRTIAALVQEDERFVQTGVGWVISDLSKVKADLAATIVERHFDDLLAEVVRRHTKYLPRHQEYKNMVRGRVRR